MSTYYPKHSENRMKNEGDVVAAREYFLSGKNRVLYRLLKERFTWMNRYIKASDERVMELGTGAGLSKEFIKTDKLVLTDVLDNEWVDEYMDALNLTMDNDSMDVIICSEMIHHVADPASFLDSICRKLKKGGRLIVQDIYTGVLMKTVLRIMRHEGWSDEIDIFERGGVSTIRRIRGRLTVPFLSCCFLLKVISLRRSSHNFVWCLENVTNVFCSLLPAESLLKHGIFRLAIGEQG